MTTIPNTLYKYRKFETKESNTSYGRHTLTKRVLFAASQKSFNDPFDNALPYKYTEESFTRDNFIEKYISFNERNNISREELIYEAIHRYNYICDNPERHWNENRNDIIAMDEGFYGILSLAKHPDNILMWSHYSENHKGYCLGFSGEILENVIAEKGQQHGATIGPVVYQENYPELDFTEMGERKYDVPRSFTKSSLWGYEDEYRMVFNKADFRFEYPKEMLIEIYLGCKMPSERKDEIVSFLSENRLDVRLYRMEMSFDKFALDPVEIAYK